MEAIVDARVLVYRAAVGLYPIEVAALDERLHQVSQFVAPSCELLRSYRILDALARQGSMTKSEALRLSMLVCETGIELRPLWPWDISRIAMLDCHPADAWCVALAETLGVPFITRNPNLASLTTSCEIEVY